MTLPQLSGTSARDGLVDLDRHRPALLGHCYRMLGSVSDADDAVQDTMLRAWRARESFDGRASARTWLTRIATNVCIDQLRGRAARMRPAAESPAGSVTDELVTHAREHWLEPVPDADAIPTDVDPHEQVELRESIRLAFVAALQYLPPRQRAAILLADVLHWSAAEVAETLDTSVAAVNSALQRARATLGTRAQPPREGALSESQRRMLEQYVDAFHRYDVDGLVSLVRDDVVFCMPPFSLWLRGRDSVAAWLRGRGAGCNGSVLVPTSASGSPAFGQYRDGGRTPWGLAVLELDGTAIAGWTTFLDTATLFPRFGLPPMVANTDR